MQSFLTILIAGTAAFAAMLMMPAEPDRSGEAYAQYVKQDLPEERMAMSVIVIEPERPLVLALELGDAFDPGFYVYADALPSLRD